MESRADIILAAGSSVSGIAALTGVMGDALTVLTMVLSIICGVITVIRAICQLVTLIKKKINGEDVSDELEQLAEDLHEARYNIENKGDDKNDVE